MKNKIYFFQINIVLILFTVGCYHSTNPTDISKLSNKDFYEIEKNQDVKRWEKIYLKSIDERINGTNIQSLKDLNLASDLIEVRIWVGFDNSPLRGIIFTKQSNGKIEGLFFPPLDNLNKPKTPRLLSSPKNGWDNLWKIISKLEILNLPDSLDIAKIDQGSVVVEIKTPDYYRNYKYSGVNDLESKAENEYKANYGKLKEFCNFLSDEFEIDLLKYYKR